MKYIKTIDGNYTYYHLGKIKKYKHLKTSGFESWREYDENGNEIHFKDSAGSESWSEYDKNGNKIHYKDSNGYERWSEYDENGNKIHYKNSNGSESWSDDNPDNPNNKEIEEEDIKPFIFK